MVLGRADQPPQRRPMDLASHHLENMREENTTRETSKAWRDDLDATCTHTVLEGHDLAGDTTIQAISVARSCGLF